MLLRVGRTMGFTKRVAPGNQRNGFFVVHRHAGECFTDVSGRRKRIRFTVRSFRVHIDQTHLNGCERVLQLSVTGIAFVAKPFSFRAPVNVFLWFPNVFATTCEAKCLEPHIFKRHITCQHHQVCPRYFRSIFLLDGPKQTASFVEISVVGPTVERGKSLCAIRSTTSAVSNAVRSCTVPGHANEQRAVVAIICWPPILRRCEQLVDVFLQGYQVEFPELLSIIKIFTHRISLHRVLVKDLQVQLVRPPIPVRQCPSRSVPLATGRPVHDRAHGCWIGDFLCRSNHRGFLGRARFRSILGFNSRSQEQQDATAR